MDIVAPPSMRAVTFTFQPQEGAFALTVVAKLTLVLAPGVCTPATEPEEIHEEEHYWDDDPKRSLYAPSDVAPLKRRADVLLVGSAFAPGGRAVRTLVARLSIGEVDKVIEVHGPRLFTATGDLREGAGWTKMPLRYERAAGGPETWNPVGVWIDGPRDPYGQKHLPNLQPAGVDLREPGQLVAPAGFGPIASAWPSRKEKLRGRADVGSPLAARRAPLGDDFDLAYFQDAPNDQQLSALRADQSILLENLHPEHERLSTRLPGLRPRAALEVSGEAPAEIALEPDTLWIDTDRALCTVTFRGHRPIAELEVKGRVRVTLDEAEARAPKPSVRLGTLGGGERSLVLGGDAAAAKEDITADMPEVPARNEPARPAASTAAVPAPPPIPARAAPAVNEVAKEITVVQQPAAAASPLPFSPTAPGAPPRIRTMTSPGAPPPRPRTERRMTEEIVLTPEALAEMAGPSWLAHPPGTPGAAVTHPQPPGMSPPSAMPPAQPVVMSPPPGTIAPPIATAPPPVPAAPPSAMAPPPSAMGPMPPAPMGPMPPAPMGPMPLAQTMLSGASPQPPGPMTSPTPLAALSSNSPLGTPAPILRAPAPPPDMVKLGDVDTRGLSSATAGGVLAASNAAAGPAPKPAARKEAPAEPAQETKGDAGGYLELLWFDKAIVPRLRSHPVFNAWMKPPPKAAPTQQGKPPPPPPTPEAIEKAERADVYNILSKDPAAAGDPSKPAGGEDDADAPLALVGGTLSFPFEEVEMLKAVLAVAKPLGAADKRLKELCDLGAELLRSDLEATEAAPGLTAKIREAWGRVNRSQPANHLDARVEQKLLEQRSYQKRSLLDGEWIRALLSTASGEAAVVYVPVKLEKRLPLFARLQVKMLAELYPPQDPDEPSHVALKVVGLARVAARPKLGKA